MCLTVLSRGLGEKHACDICSLSGPRGKAADSPRVYVCAHDQCREQSGESASAAAAAAVFVVVREEEEEQIAGRCCFSVCDVNHENFMGLLVNVNELQRHSRRHTSG